MDTWDWTPFLRHGWRTIALTTAVVVVVTMAVTLVLAPVYQSTATLVIQPLTLEQPLGFPTATELNARSTGELIKSPGVAKRAAAAVGSGEGLGAAIEYRVIEDSNLIQITAEAGTPARASQAANAIARAYIDENAATLQAATEKSQDLLSKKLADLRTQIVKLQKEMAQARSSPGGTARVSALQDQISTLQSAYQQLLQSWQNLPASQMALATAVQLAAPAIPNSSPVRPRKPLNLLLSLIGGLFLGIAVARATEMIGPTPRHAAISHAHEGSGADNADE